MAKNQKAKLVGITQITRWAAFLLAEEKDPLIKIKLDTIQREAAEVQLRYESQRESS